MTKQTAAEYFKENHYVKIENFISRETASFLYDYVKMAADRLTFAEYQMPNFDKEVYGTFEDEQAPGDYSKYGDLTFDTLLAHKLPDMEYFTGKKLIPTYSYHRLYTTETELKRHKDRPSCEISTTLCLGYDVSNVDLEKYPDWDWPMFVGPKTGEEGTKGSPIHMKPGDMIIYRGCELEHWREPYWGKNHAQVFLHYNELQGDYNIQFDGRPALGLPASSKIFTDETLKV
tara:strand:- start:1217 stop:1909 length:693 start_codon:yes stop_codon:yes gene_type:complete